MNVTRRIAGVAVAAVAALALPIALAQPALAACAPGTYPPSNCVPTVSMNAPASGTTLSVAQPSWSVVYTAAPIKYYSLRYIRARWDGSFEGWTTFGSWMQIPASTTTATITIPVGYTYCFSVRAVDTANRVSQWSNNRCTARPLDDRNLSDSAGWYQGSSSLFYNSTYSVTSRSGATASRFYGVASRISVVGEACPNCGTVGVYIANTFVGKLSFASSTTRMKVILSTAMFSPRAGAVVLRNLSTSGRLILDGVVISQK